MILVRLNAKVGGLLNTPCCTVNSMQNGLQYQAAFDQHYRDFPTSVLDQYPEAIDESFRNSPVSVLGEPNRFGQDCYDATWILALALNNTLTGKHCTLYT